MNVKYLGGYINAVDYINELCRFGDEDEKKVIVMGP